MFRKKGMGISLEKTEVVLKFLIEATIFNNFDRRYIEGDIEDKRKIIGSMYPEKLRFDRRRLRTNRVNEVAMHIYKINRSLQRKKGRTNGGNSNLSSQVEMIPLSSGTTPWVVLSGQFSNHFMEDLTHLANMSSID